MRTYGAHIFEMYVRLLRMYVILSYLTFLSIAL